MHDRLVSRRIDALHQCFLVPLSAVEHSYSVKKPYKNTLSQVAYKTGLPSLSITKETGWLV